MSEPANTNTKQSNPDWNANLYDAKHAFVWKHGSDVVSLLAPQPGERILDLGCGTGHLTAQIAESGAQVLGVDRSPEMIAAAKKSYPNLKFVIADATALPFHSEFDKLFAFGIDPVDGGLPTDQPRDWPSIAEIQDYNRKIRSAVDKMPVNDQLWNVAIEHRLMHAETLAYMLHQLPVGKKMPQPQTEIPAREKKPGMIKVPAGQAILGRSEGFGWDNEFHAHTVDVAEFEIDRYGEPNRFVPQQNGHFLNDIVDVHDFAFRQGTLFIERP